MINKCLHFFLFSMKTEISKISMTDAESRPSTMSTQFKGSYSSGMSSFAPVAIRVLELVCILIYTRKF